MKPIKALNADVLLELTDTFTQGKPVSHFKLVAGSSTSQTAGKCHSTPYCWQLSEFRHEASPRLLSVFHVLSKIIII